MPTLSGNSKFKHVVALDGIRAIAVLIVIAHHSGVPGFAGAYIGVDIFFALSGFLITSLLIGEWRDTGRIQYSRFLFRRSLRLLPALVLCVVAFTIFEWVRVGQLRIQIKNALIALSYTTNLVTMTGRSVGQFQHTWSLAIEQQFYIVWPLLFAGLQRFRGRRWQVGLLVAAAIVVASERQWLSAGHGGTRRIYAGPDTRCDSLLYGCAAAMVFASGLRPSPRVVLALFLSSIVTLLVAAALVPPNDVLPLRAAYGGVGLAAACLVLAAGWLGDSWTTAPLRAASLVWIGKISYGMYLWHYPVAIILSRHPTVGWITNLLINTAVSIAAATVSYYLVEVRFLRLKRKVGSRPGEAGQGKKGDASAISR